MSALIFKATVLATLSLFSAGVLKVKTLYTTLETLSNTMCSLKLFLQCQENQAITFFRM